MGTDAPFVDGELGSEKVTCRVPQYAAPALGDVGLSPALPGPLLSPALGGAGTPLPLRPEAAGRGPSNPFVVASVTPSV